MNLQRQKIVHLQEQNKLLKDYANALDLQNQARNQERRVLQAEIARLLNHQIQQQKIEFKQLTQLKNLRAENTRLKQQGQKLKRELQLSNFNYKAISTKNQNHSRNQVSTVQISSLKASLKQYQLKYANIQKQNTSLHRQVQQLKQQNLKHSTTLNNLQTDNRTLLSEKSSLKSKVEWLQRQLQTLHKQISQKSLRQSRATSTQLKNLQESLIEKEQLVTKIRLQLTRKNDQYQILYNLCENLKRQVSELNQKLFCVQKQYFDLKDQQIDEKNKNQQIYRLQKIVNDYLAQINMLEDQLMKFEKSQLKKNQKLRDSRSKEDSAQISRLTDNNSLLLKQNQTLNQCINDLQRRIQVLQQTNMSLREQLKASIAARNEQICKKSRISIKKPQRQDDELQIIKLMKIQIDGLRSKNNKLQQLLIHSHQQLNSYKIKNKDDYLNRVTFNQSPIMNANNSNMYSSKKVSQSQIKHRQNIGYRYMADTSKTQIIDDENQYDNQYSVSFNFSEDLTNKQYEIPQKDNQTKPTTTKYAQKIKSINSHSSVNAAKKQKYEQLQRKIKLLKNQNNALKQGIYGQIAY